MMRFAPNRRKAHLIELLFTRHADELLVFFARRTFDPQMAMDLVAETFAVAVEAQDTCRARTGAARRAWLYGIARNLLKEFYRDGSIERRAIAKLALDPPALSEESYERIEELAGLHRERVLLAAAVETLSAQHREALVLRVIEERPYPQIAGELGISEQTARTRVSRALQALRDVMDSPELKEATENA